ncbi:MAG: DUF2797 domain-containing protein [Thermoplasmatota archaeon]
MGTLSHVLAIRPTTTGRVVVTDAGPIPLTGAFSWRVTGPRHCTGRIREGLHIPCPERALVGNEATCPACSEFENPACLFEPECDRDPSGCRCRAFQGVPHLVYMAFHGTLPKVGLTQVRRLETRLREQGADGYFVVQDRTLEDSQPLDRAQARRLEREVSYLYRVPQWRSHHETLAQMARPVLWPVVERRADALRERLSGRYGCQPFHRIEGHPVLQPLPAVPHRLPPEGDHAGRWLGAKGDHLFFLRHPTPGMLPVPGAVGALKASALVGRDLAEA